MALGKKLATLLILASLVLSVSGTNGQAPTPTTKQATMETPRLVSRSGEVLMLQREQQQKQEQSPKEQESSKTQEGKVVGPPIPPPQPKVEEPKAQPTPQPQPKPQPQPEPPKESATPRESYGEWQSFVATFYTLAEGSGTGRTATGTVPKAHRTLAVDPSIIPLGSTVEIKYPDGSTERRVAEDTGGAIHGNILDVYVVTVQEALNRGRQHVQLRIVHTP